VRPSIHATPDPWPGPVHRLRLVVSTAGSQAMSGSVSGSFAPGRPTSRSGALIPVPPARCGRSTPGWPARGAGAFSTSSVVPDRKIHSSPGSAGTPSGKDQQDVLAGQVYGDRERLAVGFDALSDGRRRPRVVDRLLVDPDALRPRRTPADVGVVPLLLIMGLSSVPRDEGQGPAWVSESPERDRLLHVQSGNLCAVAGCRLRRPSGA
jgi:hypothetical protein